MSVSAEQCRSASPIPLRHSSAVLCAGANVFSCFLMNYVDERAKHPMESPKKGRKKKAKG